MDANLKGLFIATSLVSGIAKEQTRVPVVLVSVRKCKGTN